MTKKEMVATVLRDAAHGDSLPLIGMIDYLIDDCGITLKRILEIGEKHFSIPRDVMLKTLNELI